MATLTYSERERSGWLARKSTNILRLILPRKGKRAVFLTTLFMEIAKISPAHEKALKELNDYLKIVDDVESLRLPASLHKSVWKDKEFIIKSRTGSFTQKEINGICHRAIREIPEWSHYEDYDKVFEDTRKVILAYLNGVATGSIKALPKPE